MTATAQPTTPPVEAPAQGALDRAEGVALLGSVEASGYKDGAALVRPDGYIAVRPSRNRCRSRACDGHQEHPRAARGSSDRSASRRVSTHASSFGSADHLRAEWDISAQIHGDDQRTSCAVPPGPPGDRRMADLSFSVPRLTPRRRRDGDHRCAGATFLHDNADCR